MRQDPHTYEVTIDQEEQVRRIDRLRIDSERRLQTSEEITPDLLHVQKRMNEKPKEIRVKHLIEVDNKLG